MKRFYHIDFVRAVAILVIIAVHVLSDNITGPVQNFLWNVLHFGIIGFVFCSGYVLFSGYSNRLNAIPGILHWYKKRLFRLVIPFYWYLLAHFVLIVLFPTFFSGLGLLLSWKFILQSVTLTGGINLNWLPLLFLELAVLFPILVFLFNKYKTLFWGYMVCAILFTIISTIIQVPYGMYRQVMWIPWSLFLVVPWYFVKKEQKQFLARPYVLLTIGSVMVFACLYVLWSHVGRSLTLIDNKYPPNFYYLSFDGIGTFALFALSGWSILQREVVRKLYVWISKVSYSLFFIHFIVLDFILSLQKHFVFPIPLFLQMLFVVGISMLCAWLLSLL